MLLPSDSKFIRRIKCELYVPTIVPTIVPTCCYQVIPKYGKGKYELSFMKYYQIIKKYLNWLQSCDRMIKDLAL